MKPIRPARIVGGAVYAERDPIYVGPTELTRGIDLSSGRPHAVMIREPGEYGGPQSELFDLFEWAMVDRSKLAGTPVPRLLHSFGRDGRVLAVVEEYLRGVQLADVLDALLSRSAQLPVEIALLVARPLLPLWVAAESASPPIRFYLDPLRIIIDPSGGVRFLPEYAQERARQVAGAAVGITTGAIAYMAPEQIRTSATQVRSGMYTFGVLLYELLTSSHPVAGADRSMLEMLSKMAQEDLPRITLRRPGLIVSLVEFIERCTARDPAERFTDWRELSQHFAAMQAQYPAAGPADIVSYLQKVVPAQLHQEPPPLVDASVWGRMHDSGYEEVSLPVRAPADGNDQRGSAPGVLDPAAHYPCIDARPMFAVAPGLLIDAQPVTRAEYERYCILTRTRRPSYWGEPDAITDDQPCVFVALAEAEAYARWTGKRLPTEAEWNAAVATLGAAKLGAGQVWEWTATPHERGGSVVRGGRWRDQPALGPQPSNRSYEVGASADLGFRCVVDVRPG